MTDSRIHFARPRIAPRFLCSFHFYLSQLLVIRIFTCQIFKMIRICERFFQSSEVYFENMKRYRRVLVENGTDARK